MVKKWEVNKVNNEEVEQFAKKYKISNLLASILVRKEIKTDEEVAKFLHPTRMDFYNPFLLPDMEKAVKRINKAIEKNVATDLVIEDLYIVSKKENNEITSVDFNPAIVNKVLTKVTSSVQMNLKNLEEGNLDLLEASDDVLIYYDKENLKKGIIFRIPSGIVFNNSLLTNIGPKIPVRFTLVGDVLSGINTKVTNYGINNALLEVSVNIKLTLKVILPISTKEVNVETNVPIAIKMIQGNVPNYYSNGLNSNFSIPLNN